MTLPRMRLFGDTINTTSRVESTCPPGRIQLSRAAAEELQRSADCGPGGEFDVQERGIMALKAREI